MPQSKTVRRASILAAAIEPLEKRVLLSTVPNDPLFGDDGHHAILGSSDAWDLTTGSSSVIVAVLDTGLDITHPDINANVFTNPGEIAGNDIDDDGNGFVDDVNGWDFADGDNNVNDVDGHGTHVSGTIAAEGNNGLGVTGMSWSSKILPVKVFSDTQPGAYEPIVQGLQYVIDLKRAGNNIRVVNMSLGGNPGTFPYEWNNIIRQANDAGILIVVAAGNNSQNNDGSFVFPPGFALSDPNVVSVAATDNQDGLAGFSNVGPASVLVGAPGVDTLSLAPGGGYVEISGTSMASPAVAGLAALAFSLNPAASPAMVKDAIRRGVDGVAGLQRPGALGLYVETGGRVNAYKTLRAVGNSLAEVDSWTGAGYMQSGRYGTQGQLATLPAYATASVDGASQEPGGPAEVLYTTETSMTVNLNLTGGTHRVGFVMIDPRGGNAIQRIEIVDPLTGDTIAAAPDVTKLRQGQIVSFDLTGNSQVRISLVRGRRAVLADVVFDQTPAQSGDFVGIDPTTRGLWRQEYGSQWAVVVGETDPLPPELTLSGATLRVVKPNTRRADALERSGDNRRRGVLGVLQTPDTMTASLALAAEESHRLSLYLTDFNNRKRVQEITLVDSDDDVVLDRRLVSNFRGGQYLSWDVTGPVEIVVKRVSGPDAVISGLFLDAPASADVRYVGQDANTGGNWLASYGQSGAYIVGNHEVTLPTDQIPAVPDYATVGFDGSERVIVAENTNMRSAPLKFGQTRQRIAGLQQSFGSMTVNLDIDRARPSRVSLYFADYQRRRQAVQVTVRDAETGDTLASTQVTDFTNGRYVTFDISGSVQIELTAIGALGSGVGVSAIYFD